MNARRIYVVNVGHDRNGRERNRLFPTLDAARDFCNAVCVRTGIILAILVRGTR